MGSYKAFPSGLTTHAEGLGTDFNTIRGDGTGNWPTCGN